MSPQNLFRPLPFLPMPDAWIEDSDYKDPDPGQLMNREPARNQELSKIEKPGRLAKPERLPPRKCVKFSPFARVPLPTPDATLLDLIEKLRR